MRISVANTIILCVCISNAGAFAQTAASSAPPDAPKSRSSGAPSFANAVTLAPNLYWTTGTQDQTLWGGSGVLSSVRSASYCDPEMVEFGLAATASDSKTTKLGGTPTYIDSDDVKANALRGISGHEASANSLAWTLHYLGVDADWFENNSLGIGLQQTYAAQYQFDFGCTPDDKDRLVFATLGVGARFMNQRLYKTQPKVNGAVLPLSGQLSFLLGGGAGKPPKLIWYGLVGYVPVLNDMRRIPSERPHAFAISNPIPMADG